MAKKAVKPSVEYQTSYGELLKPANKTLTDGGAVRVAPEALPKEDTKPRVTKEQVEQLMRMLQSGEIEEVKMIMPEKFMPLSAVDLKRKFSNQPWEHLLFAVLSICMRRHRITEDELTEELKSLKVLEAEKLGGMAWE